MASGCQTTYVQMQTWRDGGCPMDNTQTPRHIRTYAWGWINVQLGLGLIYFLHTFNSISNAFYFPKQ